MKCCVYTRFVFEALYLNSFVEHYIRLGFDKIIILYHDYPAMGMPEIPDEFKPYVEIHNVPNLGNRLPNEYKHLIPTNMDWVLHIDSDEFLLIHKKYKNIQSYIEDKLAIHPNIHMFLFMWSWVHKLDDDNQLLDDIFRKYKKNVGNCIRDEDNDNIHDIHKKEVWVKSMFRRSEINVLYIHTPSLNIRGNYYLYSNELTAYNGTNKNQIKTLGYKDEGDLYNDAVLMHIATRSLSNSIFKAQHIHSTQVQKKNISQLESLKKYIKRIDVVRENEYDILKNLKKYVGYKIEWPMRCLKMNAITINMEDFLRGQTYNFVSSTFKDNYYKCFNSIITNTKMILAMDKVIKRYNIIYMDD